jgi:hypothetical protein
MREKATPEARRIEELDAKIEETQDKIEEKLHYRKQLLHMHRRLATNQITFDAHINAMEEALQIAIKEHDDVKALMRQLEAGKNKAVLDLLDTQRNVSVERRDRSKIISVRKLEAHNARKMEEWRRERETVAKDSAAATKGDLSAEEERALQMKLAEREELAVELRRANEAKLHEFNALEEQFTAIRQATGVNDLEEMVDKFIGQEGNRQTLLREQRDVELKLAAAKKGKTEAEAKFAELRASGVGANELNREVSDELGAETFAARVELKVTRAACGRLEGVLVALRQGAIGLFQRLEPHRYLLDSEEEGVHQTNESSATIEPVEALALSELLLGKMLENVGGGNETSTPRVVPSGALEGGLGDATAGGEDDDSAQAPADDVSSTWAALANEDVPNARQNVRVKTLAETQGLLERKEASVGGAQASAVGKSELLVAKAEGSVGEDDAAAETLEIVPTRDFLKLSSSRQHAEVMRKVEAEMKRKKMQEAYDAADDADKEKMGSVADKKKRQREAIEHLVKKKEPMGVPPGVTPKLDAMQRSQVFLSNSPELL